MVRIVITDRFQLQAETETETSLSARSHDRTSCYFNDSLRLVRDTGALHFTVFLNKKIKEKKVKDDSQAKGFTSEKDIPKLVCTLLMFGVTCLRESFL